MKKKPIKIEKHSHSKKMDTRVSTGEPVLAEKLSRKLKLSEDILAKAPIVMGYGSHRFCIENYRNIIEYTEERIRIQTKTGRIHLVGEKLVIAYFRDDGMCVMGNISSVEYYE